MGSQVAAIGGWLAEKEILESDPMAALALGLAANIDAGGGDPPAFRELRLILKELREGLGDDSVDPGQDVDDELAGLG